MVGCAKNLNQNLSEIYIYSDKKIIKVSVETANDNEERLRGLMFREDLDEKRGMLFVFEDENNRTFWMKNTLIPLDIVFINKEFEIINIEYALPCKKEPCALYKSKKPAKYVLEVNSNFTTKNDIDTGNKIVIK